MISVKNLIKTYTEEGPAVNDVSFEVNQGEIVALLGPSGCGKTTILRCVAGFEQPTSGEVYIGNKLVSSGSRGILTPVENRGLGFVHQSYALWPHKTVYKNVAYPLELRGVPQKEISRKVSETLGVVHLENYADRFPAELSGGEQQRVALARSLVYGPAAILLDEPLSNLDAKLREQTRFELRRIFKELDISALYVTHDQSEALAIADRCIVMERGRIQQIGAPIDLYTRPGCSFVADFMGSSNILRGMACGDNLQNIDVRWERFQHECPTTAGDGKDTMMCIRPKDISLNKDDPHAVNTFQAKITVKTFAGDFYKVLVMPLKQPDLEVLIHVYDYEKASNMSEGETVYVSFPPSFCKIIAS